jgi:hypothetical protein
MITENIRATAAEAMMTTMMSGTTLDGPASISGKGTTPY